MKSTTTDLTQHNAFEISNPQSLYNPTPYGYSHVASVAEGNTLIFVAGQGGEDQHGQLIPDFRAQVQQAFKNVALALESQTLTLKDVVKITTLIVNYDAEKHKILIEESERIWTDKKFPVQTLIPVPKLALNSMLFEVDAVAVKKNER